MTEVKKILYIQPSVSSKFNQKNSDKFNKIIQLELDRQMSPGYSLTVKGI